MLEEGLGLQALEWSFAKRYHMETQGIPILVHVTLIDTSVVGRIFIGQWRTMDLPISWGCYGGFWSVD
jgi:hypothetical protein